MKWFLASLLMLCLLTTCAVGLAESSGSSGSSGFQMPSITLPDSSDAFSPAFATQVIALNQTSPQLLTMMGLQTVHQGNAGKAADDASHTSAYTVCQGTALHRGESRPLLLIIISATSGSEWYANFDCMPSRDYGADYAENFLLAAQNVYEGVKPLIDQAAHPAIVVTGYSRGAACANLLGMMLNADCGAENVFVYTAATPTTVRGEAAKVDCPNIFNIINPCDLITRLPLPGWGFTRLGTDVVLPADEAAVQRLDDLMASFASVAPDVEAYYTLRRSLTSAGESPLGLTTYEVMTGLAGQLIGEANPASAAALQMLSPASDFAPIVQVFLATAEDPYSLMNQHMPATYIALFEQMQSAR